MNIKNIAVFLIILMYGITARTQSVKISTVNLYGNNSIPSDSILEHAKVKDGDSITQQVLLNRQIEKRIESIPGIRMVKTAMICCDKNNNYHLFIGVAENDSTIINYRAAPTLRIKLPEKYTRAYVQFSARVGDAIQTGQAGEDWSSGHSLIHYSSARRIQEKYIAWADEDFTLLAKVLRSSLYDDQRATAAQIIAYTPDKNRVIPELLHAVIDQSDEVRNNAIRALAVISYYASLHPEKNIRIPYHPFIRLLNSIVWSDRNKALSVLIQLSRTRDPQLFEQLKATSLPALKQMALWKSESYAVPAFIILGRMAGIPEDVLIKKSSEGNIMEEALKLCDTVR